MSDFFSFRDSMEPTGTGALRRSGGGAGAGPEGELAAREKYLNYGVEARDGHVGKVMDVEPVHGKSYLIVSTGGTILSKNVMIPAGIVERADHHAKKIHPISRRRTSRTHRSSTSATTSSQPMRSRRPTATTSRVITRIRIGERGSSCKSQAGCSAVGWVSGS